MNTSNDLRLYRFYDLIHFSMQILENQSDEFSTLISKLQPKDNQSILHAYTLAWSLVDSIHRVREVCQNIPRISKNERPIKDFLIYTKLVKDYRNYFQHLRKELAKRNIDNFPVMGSISWVDPKDNNICHSALTGTVIAKTNVYSIPFDPKKGKWLCQVTLHILDKTLPLDNYANSSIEICKYLIELLNKKVEKKINQLGYFQVYSTRITQN